VHVFMADEEGGQGGVPCPGLPHHPPPPPGHCHRATALSCRDPLGPGLAEEGAAELRKRSAQRRLCLSQGNIFLSSPS